MKDKVFLDTNVLVYLYSIDEPHKQAKAAESFLNYECIGLGVKSPIPMGCFALSHWYHIIP
jgi:hypothetical protein